MLNTVYVIIAHDCDGDYVVYDQGFFATAEAAQAVIEAGTAQPFTSVCISGYSVQPIGANTNA